MGGKGAKERRRIARLAANGGEAAESNKESPASNSNRTMEPNGQHNSKPRYPEKEQSRFSHKSKERDKRPQGRGDYGRHVPAKNPKFARPGDRQRPRAQQTTVEKKKPKVKKPKHLKRKIEKLSTEDDEATRQKLVDELKQFKARKSIMSTNAPSRKRLKPSIPAKQVSKTQVQKPTVELDEQVSEEKDTAPPLVDTNEVTLTTSSPPTVKDSASGNMNQTTTTTPHVANNDNDDSDSDSDVSLEDATRRQRGRRRRGRKPTDEHPKTLPDSQPDEPATESKSLTKIQKPLDISTDPTDKSDPTKKTHKKDDRRHCIGRKPVTDFVIGQRYPGKVVYTKQFGAFIDIGCHSDAFCHVSRVRDDFVESINDVLSICQEVSARVVEVDRKAKRVTVSLQSDARIEDEIASIEARKLRKEKHTKGKRSVNKSGDDVVAVSSSPEPVSKQAAAPAPAPIDESTMTPAELKRARKLARRAARREQQGQTGLAA